MTPLVWNGLLGLIVIAFGWAMDGPRSALIGLIAFVLGFLRSRYINRQWPWRFK